MTIATETNKIVHEGDGVQDTFTYNFKIFDEGDLAVYEDDALTIKAYTVSGEGLDAGGEVVFTSAVPADGIKVTLIRESGYTQDTDYTAYGPFPAETHEETLDKVVIQVQQLKEIVDRCLKLPKWNEDDEVEVDMDPDEDVASKILGYDISGNLELLASTDYTPGNDQDMEGNDLILSGGEVTAENDDSIIQARNAADDAYLNMIKLNASDDIELSQPLQLENGSPIDEFSTDGALAGDSDDAVPTEKAVKTYIDAELIEKVYESVVDLTNGGADDLVQYSFDVAAAVLAGATDIEILLVGVSTDAANEILHITLGDAGGEETSGYVGKIDYHTTAAHIGANYAGTSYELMDGTFFDADTILNFMRVHLIKITDTIWALESLGTHSNVSYTSSGIKTLTAILEDVILKTNGAAFDAGDAYVRYTY